MLRRALSGLVMCTVFGALAAHAGQFLEAPQYPVGSNPQAAAFGDFRNDGKRDVVVANSGNSGGNSISVLLGNGDGTFQPQTVYATDAAPGGIAVGDFNGDGYSDIAVTNSGSNTVSIFLNKGDGTGTFLPKIDTSTGNQPQGVAVGHFNGDDNLDLAVTNAADGTVGVFLGKGNGTFSAQVTYTTGFNPWSIAVGCVHAKFSGCTVMDLVVANKNNNNVISVLLGNGDGTFKTQLQSVTGSIPVSVGLADFNGDGYLDVAVADQAGNAVSVMLGTGTGSFPTHVEYPTAAFPTGVAVGDFNNDGNLDLAVSAGNGNTVSVLWGKGDGTFEGQVNAGTGDIPYSVVAADFNNDNTTDLLAANSGGNSVSVILSNGNGTFQTRTDFAAGTTPRAVATGNFNSDGFPDLVVTNSNCANFPSCGPSTISILLGNGDGTFQAPTSYSTGTDTYPYFVVVGDFNGDGIADIAVANYATNTISVFLGNGSTGVGDGTFQAHIDTSTGGEEPTSIATGDFNGDGKLDVAVTNFHTNNVSVLLGNGDGTFTPAPGSPYAAGNGPISVATGTFSGGQIDLAVVNETDNTAGVLIGNGDGTFKPQTPQTTYSTGSGGNPLSVVTGRFSNGGSLDLAVADFLTQEVSVLLGNGDGTFQAVKYYATGNANPSSIVFADFNGDGNLDLALTSTPLGSAPGNLVSLLLGNGDGTFQAATPSTLFGTGSEAYSAVVGDFNGDGAEDLAVANGVSNTVSVLLNTQGTAMSLVSSSGINSSFGQLVKLTATVAASVSNGMGAPTGTVTVMNGSTMIGVPGTLVNGQYSVSTSTLPVGTDLLSAVYTSTNGYQKHTVTLTQTVQKAASSTALTSSAASSSLNQSVTFTATVSPSTSGQPTGTVTFLDGTTPLGSPALSAGVATLAISTLAIGTHTITGSYSGDGNFSGSNSNIVSLVVTAAAPNFSLSSSPASLSLSPGASGQSTITVIPLGGLNPSTVALSCSISTTLSPAPTCSLGGISVANSVGSSMLTVATTGAQAALAPAPEHASRWLLAVGLLMPAMLLSAAGFNTPGRRKLLGICLIFLVLSGCLLQVACGGSGSNNTPPATKTNQSTPAGTYTVTITGNASGEQHTTSVSLTVQ
ncbi:MAG: FG-GAP-like repeat-containing protein [Candidatus Sulfotelmatobacter sp.]